jgi:hypothetical protein
VTDRHAGGCIYCGSLGPFSDEHVVSAGLGGDDDKWLLTGCVCRVCNTEIFSKLEVKFLRASPVAIARLFLQDRTRDRGNRTAAPSIQPNVMVYRDELTGTLLAAQMGGKGATTILPQIVALPRTGAVETAVSGSDSQGLRDFLARFDARLTDELMLIEKRRECFEFVFDLTPLSWVDDAYKAGAASTSSKPAKDGIWLEALTRPATAGADDRLPLAVFGLPSGQIVCRAGFPAMAGALLSFLRQNPQVRQSGDVGPATAADAHPGVHLRLGIDLAGYDRVYTKIGINLCASILGLDLVRNPAFDRAVDYARHGIGAVFKAPAMSEHVLGPPLPDCHVMVLWPAPGGNGGHCIVFMAQLYGGPIERFRLAEFAQPIDGLSEPVVIHVNYQKQRIERLTLEEHVIRVAAIHGDWTASGSPSQKTP